MGRRNVKYVQLSSAKIQEKRNVVISASSVGGFTMAQQVVVDEGKHQTPVFLKPGIIIKDIEGLYNLRDALNVAISKTEKVYEEEINRRDEN